MLKLRSIFVTSLLTGLVATSNFGCGGSSNNPSPDASDTRPDTKPDGGAGGDAAKPDSGSGGADAGDANKSDADAGDTSDVKPDATDAADTATEVKPDAGDAGDAGEAGDAMIMCPATPVCMTGANPSKRCGPNGGVQTCVTISGCPDWSAESACAGHQACTNGVCGCVAEPRCTVAGPFCDTNGNLGACSADGMCLFVSTAPAACAAGKVCGGAPGAGACSCAATACNGTASISCVDTGTARTCAAGTNGCVVPTDTVCGPVKTCQAGNCACPAAGTHLGEGCTLQSAQVCQGTDILFCFHDDATQCNVWQISDQCDVDASARASNPHPANLTCGNGPTGTGAAACQCLANATTTVYVDPAAGSDATNSPRYPTGVLEPPACRFATLGHGLGVAGVKKVIAVSDNAATTPVAFEDEALPLTIADGVIVVSSDNDPTHYGISLNGGTSLGFQLSSESILQGFTLTATAVSGSASAISFPSAAHARVDTVVIEGKNSLTHAIVIGGTATADLNAVTINQTIGSAIDVSVSGANKTVTIAGSHVNKSFMGLRVLSGTAIVIGSTFDANNSGITALSSALAILNLAGTAVTNSTSVGVSVDQGALVADQGTSVDSGQMGDGIVGSNGAHLTLTGTSVTHNNVGITSSGNSTVVSITGGAHIDGNKSNGIAASNLGTSLTPGLTIGGSTSVGSNGGDGIVITGAIATIAGADIHENGGATGNGIHVLSPSGTAVVQIGGSGTTTIVQKNGGAGILVEQAPVSTAGNASSVFIDTTTVDSNGGIGIDLSPSNGATVFATLKNATITNNHGTGVVVAGTRTVPGGQTDTSFSGNSVSSNGFSALTDSVGGILFDQPSTLSSFIGNSIFGNNGNQLAFNKPQVIDVARSITTTWKISAPTCDSPPSNKIYHYSGAGLVGLRVAGGVSVDASNVHWQDATPISGTDISNTGMITPEPHCSTAP